MIGVLLIGLIETMWAAYFTIDYKDVATLRKFISLHPNGEMLRGSY